MLHKEDYSAEQYFLSFKEGEEQGFNYFFHLHYKPLVHFAFTIVNDKDEAEDIVEDSFVKFWGKRTVIKKAGAVKSYLYTIVKNQCITRLRRKGHHTAYLKNITSEPERMKVDIEHNIIMAEAMNHVYNTLETLPPQSAEIIQLYYVEGRGIAEIADKLHLSLDATKSRKANALKLLRKKLPYLRYLMLLSIFF